MKLVKKINFYRTMMLFGTISVFLLSIRHINELYTIVGWDELGYWGVGAWLAGFDWTNLVSEFSAYYSYGYGVWIALILKVIKEPMYLYKSAIILNAIFICFCFLLSTYVGKRLFHKLNDKLIVVVSFMSTVYGNTLFQASFAWSETLITLLFWVILALFVKLDETEKKWIVYILIALSTVYLYTVHQRNLGIVIASVITIIIVAIKNKKQWIQIILVLGIIIILLLFSEKIKEMLQFYIWQFDKNKFVINDYSSMIPDSTRKFTSIVGVVEMVKSFVCRIFTWGCSTFMVAFLFFELLLRKLWECMKKKEINISYGFIFCFLGVLGNIGVFTISLSQQGTYQALLYGRYMDAIIGPVILISLLELIVLVRNKTWRELSFRIVIYFTLLVLMKFVVESVQITRDYFVPNCNVELFYWWSFSDKKYDLYGAMVVAFFVFVLLVVNFKLFYKKKIFIYVLFCIAIIYTSTRICVSDEVYEMTTADNNKYTEFLDTSKIIREDVNQVYIYYDKDNWRITPFSAAIQLFLYDIPVKLIEDIKDIESGYVFIVKNEDKIPVNLLRNNMQCIDERTLANLYRIEE